MGLDRDVRGVRVPSFLYGTAWKEDRTRALTRQALDAGFRGIDTANQRRHYLEAGVGEAVADFVADGHARREDLFLQTKFTYVGGQDHRLPYDPKADPATQVRQSFASSLEHLRTTYVDSYVLHGPSSGRGWSAVDRATWQAMEELHRSGQARLLGVSNVSLEQLQALLATCSVAPAFVQNRCFASTGWDAQVRRTCAANEMAYQGFSLLTANAREMRAPAIVDAARRTGRTPAEVVFRYALEAGMVPLTGSTSREHLAADLSVFDFTLNYEEIRAIEAVGA
jgi:diketogulonate reductase-like aldo/keto reductase